MIALLLLLAGPARAVTLTVDQAVAIALDGSHGVAAAQAGVDAAQADARKATLALGPALTGAAGYTRLDQVPYVEFDTSAFLGGSTGGDACADIDEETLPAGFTLEMAQGLCELIVGWMTPDLGDAGASRIEMGLQDNYFAKLTLEQVVFAGGALHRARLAARKMVTASEAEVRRARQEVAYSATEAFYALAMARQGARVSQQAVETLDAYVLDLQNLVDVGMASRADLLATQARQSQARLDALRAAHGASLAETMLRATLGLPPDEPVELVVAEPTREALPPRDELVATALQRRPDLAGLDASIDAMGHYGAAAWSSWLPAVVVQGNLNWKNPNYALEPEWYRSADLTVAGSWSFWDRGVALSGAAGARAQRTQLVEQRSLLADYLAVEIEAALGSYEEAWAELEVATLGLSQAEEALRLEQDRFAQGMVQNAELLAAQAAVAGARVSLLQARTRIPLARAALDKAVGTDPEVSR